MKTKTQTIISWVLLILPSLMLLMSSAMKLTAADELVKGFEAMGLGKLLQVIGVLELVSVVLLLIPKTYKIGFLLITGYLGGAMSIELAAGQFPMAAVLLSVIWIAVYLRNKQMFLNGSESTAK
ncbi:MAG: DoxX family protein [Bacteroidetes bacterium]|nr:DoxX family protein [Bacteroidota bacterium]